MTNIKVVIIGMMLIINILMNDCHQCPNKDDEYHQYPYEDDDYQQYPNEDDDYHQYPNEDDDHRSKAWLILACKQFTFNSVS